MIQEKRRYKKDDWVVIHVYDVPNHYRPDGIFKITSSYTDYPDVVYFAEIPDGSGHVTAFAQKYIVRKATPEEINQLESNQVYNKQDIQKDTL